MLHVPSVGFRTDERPGAPNRANLRYLPEVQQSTCGGSKTSEHISRPAGGQFHLRKAERLLTQCRWPAGLRSKHLRATSKDAVPRANHVRKEIVRIDTALSDTLNELYCPCQMCYVKRKRFGFRPSSHQNVRAFLLRHVRCPVRRAGPPMVGQVENCDRRVFSSRRNHVVREKRGAWDRKAGAETGVTPRSVCH